MFKPVKARGVEEYMAMLAPERREILMRLDKFIRETVPSLRPHFAYNMPGYGSFKYKNYKKELVDWPVVSLASQKNYISLYICAVDGGEYLAEKHKDKLGKVSVGKSCIRFRKIEDLNLNGLGEVLKQAARTPGLVNTGVREKK